MKDQQDRTINYLRISVTDLCNLRCIYCMPEAGVKKIVHRELLSFEEMVALVKIFAALGVKKIRLTGGEPLVKKGLADLIAMLKEIEGINEIAMTTNGVALREYANPLKKAGLDRVNVSLDSLREHRFQEITRCFKLKEVLAGMQEALTVGLSPLKINTVIMKGMNVDEILNFIEFAITHGLEWRFIEFMPLVGVHQAQKDFFVSNTEVRRIIEQRHSLISDPHASSRVSDTFFVEGTSAKVGFISPMSHKFCHRCNRIRLTADGHLIPCLLNNKRIDLRTLLRNVSDPAAVRQCIIDAILHKPLERLKKGCVAMSVVGG